MIILAGNVAYLNQFFSVLLMTTNAAPELSNLVVRDIRAEISLCDKTESGWCSCCPQGREAPFNRKIIRK